MECHRLNVFVWELHTHTRTQELHCGSSPAQVVQLSYQGRKAKTSLALLLHMFTTVWQTMHALFVHHHGAIVLQGMPYVIMLLSCGCHAHLALSIGMLVQVRRWSECSEETTNPASADPLPPEAEAAELIVQLGSFTWHGSTLLPSFLVGLDLGLNESAITSRCVVCS